jgi:predicted adenylyl cyclase CyaB
MPVNIEIKARVSDWERLRSVVEALSDSVAELLQQEDVFFVVEGARLKLRIFDEHRGELIHYQRDNRAAPKPSYYQIAPTNAPAILNGILSSILVVLGTVRKRRLLYRVGQTRIHLDQVEHLGEFVELEVVLHPDQNETEGVVIAQRLMNRLGIAEEHLVKSAYIELLLERQTSQSPQEPRP